MSQSAKKGCMMELTTGHYDKDFDPNPVVLLKAAKEAALVLPRQIKQRPAPKTRKERIPLCSSLHGPGRAGTHTTLFGSNGSKYIGQVLAGRPHGSGQFYEQGPKPGSALQLVYEGEFVRGVRHGQGTSYSGSRSEVFSGQWVDGKRTGLGKVTYVDGSVYEGMWQNNVRHGVGTLRSPSTGSMFVGTFVQDRRQGLGVTYWAGRGKKHVAEYADDMATCGAMMDLDDESVEAPATQELRDAIAAARLRAAGAAAAAAGTGGDDAGAPGLPELKLIQPSKVLAQEFGDVRYMRDHRQPSQPGLSTAAMAAAVEAPTGTLTANTITLLRHAFILIAGGDDLAAHVLPHQLQELVVLAGLDPAASVVLKLLGLLHRRIEERGCRKLFLDDLLNVAAFYRETPLAVLLQLQSQQVAAATGVGDGRAGDRQQTCCSSGAEVWVQEQSSAAGELSVEEELWGDGNGQDMLAHRIAQHTPVPAPCAGVQCFGQLV